MKTLEKSLHLQTLYAYYGELLTDKQKLYFEGYYYKDYSIGELAENNDVSRNAVFDQLKRVEHKLLDIESKLRFVAKSEQRQSLLNKAIELNNDDILETLLIKIMEIE